MSFKFSTNFLLPYVRKPAKYGGHGSIGLDATPTVLIHICHPVCVYLCPKVQDSTDDQLIDLVIQNLID